MYKLIFSRILIVVLLFLLAITQQTGCSFFKSKSRPEYTKIISTLWGQTTHVKQFKVGGSKPSWHVIWGKDTEDGAHCTITISNTTRAVRVYRIDFVYKKASACEGYNYFRSRIVEYEPEWHLKIGDYLLGLTVDGKRISNDLFSILP